MLTNVSNNKVYQYFLRHKVWGIIVILALVSVVYMWIAGTITYPYIMTDRQIESVRECTFGSQTKFAEKFGYTIGAPEGYCILPNRLFPADGSVEILPKGWYFVFNEYAMGTVANASIATILFEPMTAERSPDAIIETLIKGKFLERGQVTSTTTVSGQKFTLATGALGTDGEPYDWAFSADTFDKYFAAVITKHSADQKLRWYVINNLIKQ